jgi:diguanylate cyclase (GGDEF)-like protein
VQPAARNSMAPAVFVRAAGLTVALDRPRHDRLGAAVGCGAPIQAASCSFGARRGLSTGVRVALRGKVLVIMKLSTRFADALPTQWFDWKRRDTRDAIVIVGIAIFAYAVGTFYDFALALFRFGIAHADQEADDIIFVVFILGIAMTVFGFRRYQDLSREIEARSAAERDARDLARHDSLTGLPNRRFFEEKLDEYLGTVDAMHQMAVLMLDLDGFKMVNDTYGHAAGDKALSEFARRVSKVLRPGTFLARIGGDEFAIIKSKIDSLDDPTNLARRIAAAVAEPFVIDEVTAEFGVGIGIAIAPNDGIDPEELIRRADRALYRAKATGRSSVCFFELEMDARVKHRMQMERELRSAIAAEVIVPHYQPLVSLDGNRIIGFEALARWESKSLGYIGPDVFIPIAEEIGLMPLLSGQLLRRACLDAKAWPSTFTLAFNISPVQLRDPTVGLRILSILAETGFSPRRLEIEITESALVENIAVAQAVFDELRAAGIRIALDDFGTGYSTLGQLLSFRLDKIKIDRSFVSRLNESNDAQVIVRAILGLAKGFGLTTTAEGVEDAGQLAYLKANGCTEGQGYLFSKAVSAADIPALLNRMPCTSAAA